MAFTADETSLTFRYDSETLRIEAWGPNAVRVRASHEATFPADNWALDEEPARCSPSIQHDKDKGGTFTNGNISVSVTARGKITMRNQRADIILEEFSRNRVDPTDAKASALRIDPREFKATLGSESWHLTARFESLDPKEKIFGMGQYQQPYMDLKGADLELAHRNSQASVPFAVSSLGYGFLWNNPSVGRAVFGKNQTTFEALSTHALDYWVVAGETPAEIVRAYTGVTGRPPEMPEYGLGFWQCKLRYQTPEQILDVARKHKSELGLPMDVIVVDYFHWPKEGEWKFDPAFWPDPGEQSDAKCGLCAAVRRRVLMYVA